MGIENIIKLTKHLKLTYKDEKNIIDIAKALGFKVVYMNLNPSAIPAYTTSMGDTQCIHLNSNLSKRGQIITCAHELGHALLHKDLLINQFGDEHNGNYEYEANLFAVALLFNQDDFNVEFNKMSNYELKYLLDCNIY